MEPSLTFQNILESSGSFLEHFILIYENFPFCGENREAYLERKAPAFARMKEDKEKREAEREAKRREREEAESAFFESQRVAGSVLHLTELPAEGTRENLKELFDDHAKVKWVDYR